MARRIAPPPAEDDRTRVIERPDGFYWQTVDGKEHYGPFPTLRQAVEAMNSGERDLEPGESLAEAEEEIGMADWIDPDTGEPAEGSVPRIEDH